MQTIELTYLKTYVLMGVDENNRPSAMTFEKDKTYTTTDAMAEKLLGLSDERDMPIFRPARKKDAKAEKVVAKVLKLNEPAGPKTAPTTEPHIEGPEGDETKDAVQV